MANAGIKLEVSNEKQFKRELDDVNAALKLLDANSKFVASQFDATDQSTEALTAQIKSLNLQLSAQQAKLEITQNGFKASNAAYGEADKRTLKWAADIAKTETALNDLEKEIKENKTAIDNLDKSTEQSRFSLSQFADAAKIGKSELAGWLKTTASTTAGNLISQGLTAAGQQVKEFVSMAISQATDLTEIQNVIDTVFGSANQKIYDFANSAAQNFGLATLEAQRFAGSMGAFLSSANIDDSKITDMSQKLVGLAGDMASFYNTDPSAMFEKLQSALSGQIMPLREFGVDIQEANLKAFALAEGISKPISAMEMGEKVMLRYQYILEGLSNAQGDFARTSDSFANQQRIAELQIQNLAATLGQELLPVLNEILTKINEELPQAAPKIKEIGESVVNLMGFISDNSKEVTIFVSALGTMATALKISQTASAAATALSGVAGAATTAATASTVAAAAMNAIPLVAIATGATLAANGIAKLIVDLKYANPEFDAFNAKLAETAQAKGMSLDPKESDYASYADALKQYDSLFSEYKELASKENELRDAINTINTWNNTDNPEGEIALSDEMKRRMLDVGLPTLLEELQAELNTTMQAELVANELQMRTKNVVDNWEGARSTFFDPGKGTADIYAAKGAEASRLSDVRFNQAIEAEKKNLEKLSSAWSELDHQYAMHTIATEEELYQKRQELLEELGKPEDTNYYKYYEKMTAYTDKQAEMAADAAEAAKKEAEKAQEEAKKEADKAAEDIKQREEEIKRQGEDIAQAVADSIDAVDKTYERKFDELASKKSAYAAKLSSFAGEIFAAKPDEDGNYIIGNIDKIIARMESFNEDMQKLKASGASEGMLNELMGLDPEAAAQYADYLANASASEFDALNAQYQKAQALADEMAAEFYASDYQSLEIEKANAKIQAITDTINTKLQESEANAGEAGRIAGEEYLTAFQAALNAQPEIVLPEITTTIPDTSIITQAAQELQQNEQNNSVLMQSILTALSNNTEQPIYADITVTVNSVLPGIEEIASTVTQIQNQRLQRIGG